MVDDVGTRKKLEVNLNIKGTSDLPVSSDDVKIPKVRQPIKYDINVLEKQAEHKFKPEDIRLVNSPVRLSKSTYPIRLYLNHDEVDLSREWGWEGAFRLFCDYCADYNHDKYLTLGKTKRTMGLCICDTREDLLVNIDTDKRKIIQIWGLWFNTDVPVKRDLGVAIFNISDFMGFKYVALEIKKFDNSEFN